MRTYSHAILTHRAFRRLGAPTPTAASPGAVLPDLPAIVGAVGLAANRLGRFSRRDFETKVCGRGVFAGPDAALHSALPVALAALAVPVCLERGATRTALLSLLLGWVGHVTADVLTHESDARPPLWPVSSYRLRESRLLPRTRPPRPPLHHRRTRGGPRRRPRDDHRHRRHVPPLGPGSPKAHPHPQ